MTVSREAIFKALFELGQNIEWNIGTDLAPKMVGFKTTSRRIKLFSDVPGKEQPWFGQSEHDETYNKQPNLPYNRTFKAQWIIYHRAGDTPNFEPTIWNNLILDQVELALAPSVSDPGYFDRRNTLSGLVYNCFISGEVFKDPGDIDNQALLVIPININVP